MCMCVFVVVVIENTQNPTSLLYQAVKEVVAHVTTGTPDPLILHNSAV